MTSIFVGNLSYDTSESALLATFERYGRVRSVRVPTDAVTGKSKGFAFVDMPSLDDADEAIKRLNGSSLAGRTIVVNEARGRGEQSKPVVENRWHLI